MIFRDVQLVNSGIHSDEKLEQNRYLMFFWENIRDIFCTLLPEKFDLKGISKVNIYLGPFEGEDFLGPANDGIAVFKRCDFDYEEFKKLPVSEKNRKSLYYVEDSLLEICKRLEAPSEVSDKIRSISQNILDLNFELHRIYKKVTKWSKSRNLQAVTTLHHKPGGIDVEVTIRNKNGDLLISNRVKSNSMWYSVWFDIFKSRWDGSKFIIENRVGATVYEIHAPDARVT